MSKTPEELDHELRLSRDISDIKHRIASMTEAANAIHRAIQAQTDAIRDGLGKVASAVSGLDIGCLWVILLGILIVLVSTATQNTHWLQRLFEKLD